MPAVSHTLEVWGDLACFSRPELKVERFSYPLITPSAARGIFDAIYVKPRRFRWQIERIEILTRPSYIALRRNEVKDVANVHEIGKWMRGAAEPSPLWADGDKALTGSDERGRTQRQTMALRGPRYRLCASIRPWPGCESQRAAFDAQFRRRAAQGKCFHQPYFGCREFPAYFRLVDDALAARPSPIDLDLEVGLMLYDVFDLSRPSGSAEAPAISLFPARVRRGVLRVPDYDAPEVLRTAGRL